jgi:hypothetical protein
VWNGFDRLPSPPGRPLTVRQTRVCIVAGISNTNRYSWKECLPVEQVQNLPLRQIIVLVYDRNLFGQTALSKSVAERRTNGPCANDNDFAPLP